jgi:hypothetical protein
VLRRILGLKREALIGGWRKLHSEERPDLHFFLPNIIRIIKSEDMMGRSCGTYGDEERCIQDHDGETRRNNQEDLGV